MSNTFSKGEEKKFRGFTLLASPYLQAWCTVVVHCFSDPGLFRILCCMVLYRSELMVSSLFVMSCVLCNVIFIIALCSHVCVIFIFYYLLVICSWLITICFFVRSLCKCFVYAADILKKTWTVMSFICGLHNTNISALVNGNETHWYRTQKSLTGWAQLQMP